MNRVIFSLYLFFAILYACSFGLVLGVFGGIFAWPQYLFHRLKLNASYYKYYPDSMQKKYFEMQLSQLSSEKEKIGKTFDLALGKIKLPHPVLDSFLVVLVYLPLLLYLPLKGIVYGPIHSFERWMFYWEDRRKKEN